MKDVYLDYWCECVSLAAEECDLVLTDDQLTYIAESVRGGHENYGMAFYQPESPYPGGDQAPRGRAVS